MNNIADVLANEGRLKGRVFDVGSLSIPTGWVDMAPVLCHQPLDFLTKLVVRAKLCAPAKTLKFELFSDRWMVSIGNMFGVVLDPGNCIGKVWKLPIPEGMKEVLWKEMNGAQVLGHRYFGSGNTKSDMGWCCPCGTEMSLGHILIGCGEYRLQPLVDTLLDVLTPICLKVGHKTLTPDAWGYPAWYPVLALGELEELTYPIVKGRKAILKTLKKSRQQRLWVIGNYYWALWKWRMKEIHDKDFKFSPAQCVDSLCEILLTPVPPHLLLTQQAGGDEAEAPGDKAKSTPLSTRQNATKLPPPMSHIMGGMSKAQLTSKGKSILRAIMAPQEPEGSGCFSRRETILKALTDDAYT